MNRVLIPRTLRRILKPVVSALVLATACLPASAATTVVMHRVTAFNQYYPRIYPIGGSVSFDAIGFDSAATLQWLHDDVPIPGAVNSTLDLVNLQPTDSGNYSVRTTSQGAISTSAPQVVNVVTLPPSSVDTSFRSDLLGFSTSVRLYFYATDGSMVYYDPGQSPPAVGRLNANGSRDSSFHFDGGTSAILAGYPDGSLVISDRPYRLNRDGSARTLELPPPLRAMNRVDGALVQPDGKLLLYQIGLPLIRLKTDDTVDPSFSYSTPGYNFTPYSYQLDATGRIYVRGTDNQTRGLVVFRLLPNGAFDENFTIQRADIFRSGDEPQVYILSNQRILLQNRDSSGRVFTLLNDNGAVDSTWSSPPTPGFNFTVDPVNLRIFYLGAKGIQRALITPTGLVLDPTFYQGDGQSFNLFVDQAGSLFSSGPFDAWDGFPSSRFVKLQPGLESNVPASSTIGPDILYPQRGSTVTFTANASGTGPFSYRWLALDGQQLPADVTSSSLIISDVSSANFGRFQVRITGPGGTVLSTVTRLGFSENEPHLANLSGRAFVGAGDDTVIGGLAVRGSAVPVLMRGAGPALAPYGVSNAMPNPVLNLYNGAGQLLRNNDTWGGLLNLVDAARSVGAFPFPADSNDAAFTTNLTTGTTSLQLNDISGGSGVGLVELYRLPVTSGANNFVNLSLRARTGPGEKVATAGFVISDPQGFQRSMRLLLRVVGPTLLQSGVAFPLPDPVLKLYNSAGELVATNDNWSSGSDSAAIVAAASQVGAFALPTGSKDAVLLMDVPAGVYSIQASSAPGTPDSGVTLIEIYVVQ